MQTQHSKGVKNTNALIEHLLVDLARIICLCEHPVKLLNLLNAALPSDDSSDRSLDRRLLQLQVLHLFTNHWHVLSRLQPTYAVQKHSPVVVRDKKAVPHLQEFVLQVIDNVSRSSVAILRLPDACLLGLCPPLLVLGSWSISCNLNRYSTSVTAGSSGQHYFLHWGFRQAR